MKNCVSCSNMLSEDATYCYVCSSPQVNGYDAFASVTKHDNIFLKILCGFTIVGSVLTLLLSPLTWKGLSSDPTVNAGLITGMMVLVSAGKLAGAVFMLKRKVLGLHIYTGAALMGIITNLILVLKVFQFYIAAFKAVISFAVLLFPITFLVLYWLPVNRKTLS